MSFLAVRASAKASRLTAGVEASVRGIPREDTMKKLLVSTALAAITTAGMASAEAHGA